MKRNMKVIRAILEAIDSNEDYSLVDEDIQDYLIEHEVIDSQDAIQSIINYHIMLCYDNDLITRCDSAEGFSGCLRLTWFGHDFLNEISKNRSAKSSALRM